MIRNVNLYVFKFKLIVFNCCLLLGRSNVNKCLTIMPQGQGGVCYKFRAMLTQAYFFTHRIKTHRAMRWWFLNPDKRKAFEMLGNDDAELNFFDIKLSCEV